MRLDTAARALERGEGGDLPFSALLAECTPEAVRRGGPAHARAAARFATALANANAQTPGPRTALMLSGGGPLGNYHFGVVRALAAEGLLPDLISGASAGAFVGAILATRTDDALLALLADDGRELAAAYAGMRTDIRAFSLSRFLATFVPDVTLAEARAISGRTLAIVVADADGDGRGGGRVLSPDATPNVLLRDAVLASCAIPFVRRPRPVGQRDADGRLHALADGAHFIDGSVHDDLPAGWLRREAGATHVIASLANPFERPFHADPDALGPMAHAAASFGLDAMRGALSMGLAATLPFAAHIPGGGQALGVWKRMVDQRPEADVVISPGAPLMDVARFGEAISAADLARYMADGEAATRAKLPLIAPMLIIERALRG